MFAKKSGTWLSCGSYGVYVAITVVYIALTGSKWQSSSKRHIDPVTTTQIM